MFYPNFFIGQMFFPFWLLSKFFSLCLIFCSLNMQSLNVELWYLPCLVFCRLSGFVLGLVFDINFGIFSIIIASYISPISLFIPFFFPLYLLQPSLPFPSFLSFCYSNYVYVTFFVIVLQFWDILLHHFHFFNLCISIWKFLLTFLQDCV